MSKRLACALHGFKIGEIRKIRQHVQSLSEFLISLLLKEQNNLTPRREGAEIRKVQANGFLCALSALASLREMLLLALGLATLLRCEPYQFACPLTGPG